MYSKSDFNGITPEEFESLVPVDDLCMALGMVCAYQIQGVRHYYTPDRDEITVNVPRNQWCMKSPNIYGSASQLWSHLRGALNAGLDVAASMMETFYKERENTPKVFPYMFLRGFPEDFIPTKTPDYELMKTLTRLGLTAAVVREFCTFGTLPKITAPGERESVIAFTKDFRNGPFITFNGHNYRTVGDWGISTYGNRRRDQICMVYENPLDFLAIMQSVEQRGFRALQAHNFHLIINGENGVKAACEYLHANPDFIDVRCLMPNIKEGRTFFEKINEAVKGTAVVAMEFDGESVSLLGKHMPAVPQKWLKRILPPIHPKKDSGKTKSPNVGQNVKETKPLQRPEIKTHFPRNGVIDMKTGSIKLK